MNKENKIPDSEFKKQLSEFGLIKPETIENINTKTLYKEYNKYKEEIEGNNKQKNIIIGEIIISSNDINKDIRIISSSFNEEIKQENIEIRINGKNIGFSNFHIFNKEGKYKIEYLFKKDLRDTNHMFSSCEYLTNLIYQILILKMLIICIRCFMNVNPYQI